MTRRVIKYYLAFGFLLVLSQGFFFATYQLFLAERGMSLLEVNLINGFFMLANFLLEVPTGAFADVYGRKWSVVAGCFILSVSFISYYFAGSFWQFVGAEVVGALGATLISGAMSAWVVDLLNHHGYGEGMAPIFQRREIISKVGRVIGSVSGGYLGSLGLALPWLAAGIGCALTGLFAWRVMSEAYFAEKKSRQWREIGRTAISAMRYSISHRSILYLTAFIGLYVFAMQPFNMYWPNLFKNDYQLSVAALGWLFTGVTVATFFGNLISGWISKRFGASKTAVILPQAVTAVAMMVASSRIGFFPVLTAFMLHEAGRGVLEPLRETYLNERIKGNAERATVLSFQSMVGKGGAALGLIASGLIAQSLSINASWFVFGLLLFIAVLTFFRLKNGEERLRSIQSELAVRQANN